MKSRITYVFLTALVLWAMVSCSPFTAPRDPVSGIRQDAPTHWQGQPNPLDTPGTEDYRLPPSHGKFGPGWLDR